MPKTVHGVYLVYGKTKVKVSLQDLLLIADALERVIPDSENQAKIRACKWARAFEALSEYAKSVRRA